MLEFDLGTGLFTEHKLQKHLTLKNNKGQMLPLTSVITTKNIVGPAGIYLQILISFDGICHSIDNVTNNTAVNTCLLLHGRYHSQIDLLDGKTVQRGIQQHIQL